MNSSNNINLNFNPSMTQLPSAHVNEIDNSKFGEIIIASITVALSAKVDPIFDRLTLSYHIHTEVIPRIEIAKTVEELHAAMAKVYKAAPIVRSYLHDLIESIENTSVQYKGKGKFIKWLNKIFLKVAHFLGLIRDPGL